MNLFKKKKMKENQSWQPCLVMKNTYFLVLYHELIDFLMKVLRNRSQISVDLNDETLQWKNLFLTLKLITLLQRISFLTSSIVDRSLLAILKEHFQRVIWEQIQALTHTIIFEKDCVTLKVHKLIKFLWISSCGQRFPILVDTLTFVGTNSMRVKSRIHFCFCNHSMWF